MSNVEPLLERNRAFAATGSHESLLPNPKQNLFVITCFDSRVDPAHILGTDLGDLVVMRNEGGRVTKESSRSSPSPASCWRPCRGTRFRRVRSHLSITPTA